MSAERAISWGLAILACILAWAAFIWFLMGVLS